MYYIHIENQFTKLVEANVHFKPTIYKFGETYAPIPDHTIFR